jgi:hypothetical protein
MGGCIAAIARHTRTLAALTVVAGLLGIPVQCSLLPGPHSIFVPAAASAAPDHAHHHRPAARPVAFQMPDAPEIAPVLPLLRIGLSVAVTQEHLVIAAGARAPLFPPRASTPIEEWMGLPPGAPP